VRLPTPWSLIATSILATSAMGLVSCAAESQLTDKHKVYFVAYVYDGARGVRLAKGSITSVAIRYRDKSIATDIDADGRVVAREPLPTWQDYAVYITADGYRPFVSHNPGIDIPASVAMTDGLGGLGTIQTFHYGAYLFPTGLKAPALVLNIEYADGVSVLPAAPFASALRATLCSNRPSRLRRQPPSHGTFAAGPTTKTSSIKRLSNRLQTAR
jgi:hypothetical protein